MNLYKDSVKTLQQLPEAGNLPVAAYPKMGSPLR